MTAPAVFFIPSNCIQPVGYDMLVGILGMKKGSHFRLP